MERARVAVVGAGQVGATTAQRIAEAELADVVLIDIVEGMPQGKALDLMEAAPALGSDASLSGSNDLEEMRGSDIVVLTAGVPRKPGMSRDDLVKTNSEIVSNIASLIPKVAPDAIAIVVSNPLDVMTYVAWAVSGLPDERVFGMAGVLDSARFSCFIARELDVSVKDVRAMVLGGHGDAMVPLPRYSTVSGIPVTELLPADRIEALIERTRRGGAEILSLLKTGSAYYAPSASVAAMVASVLRDQRRILPCCVRLTGQYGLEDVFAGTPAKLGREGIAGIIELKLTEAEAAMLAASAQGVRENCAGLGIRRE